jgi:hypothetical protein
VDHTFRLGIQDKKQFVKEIKGVLIHNPSHTVDEFLLFCQDQQLTNKGKMVVPQYALI